MRMAMLGMAVTVLTIVLMVMRMTVVMIVILRFLVSIGVVTEDRSVGRPQVTHQLTVASKGMMISVYLARDQIVPAAVETRDPPRGSARMPQDASVETIPLMDPPPHRLHIPSTEPARRRGSLKPEPKRRS